MNGSIDWEKFILRIDNSVLIAPCLKFVLYLDSSDDTGILDFYERAMEALADSITHYQTENMKKRANFQAQARTIVPTWFKRPRGNKDYFIALSSDPQEQGGSPSTIELRVHRRPWEELAPEQIESRKSNWRILFEQQGCKFSPLASALRVTLPLNHALADPERLLSWVLGFKLVKDWPFLSGHCGYALNHHEAIASSATREQMQKRIGSLCLRYPGLDWHNVGGVEARLLHYDAVWMERTGYFLPLIKRVNWLSLIGKSAIAYLGGATALRESLSTDVRIGLHALEHGMLVQAGNAPQLGDLGHRDFLPAYRSVAKLLRPVRLESIPGLGRGFTDEAANEWLNAFDKEYN